MKDKFTIDLRAIGEDGQYAIRLMIARLLDDGKTTKEIITLLGVNGGYVYKVKKAYTINGLEGLKIGQRGRREGEKRILSPEQEQGIKRILLEQRPERHGFKESLWTRNNIHALILERYQIDLALSTLGYYLSRWGLTVQRPVRRARKQNAEEIAKWLEEDYPKICERANEEEAEVFFGDETNIQNTANYMKGYAEEGHPPVVEVESKKLKINMLAAVSRRGMLRFMLYEDSMNAHKLLDFMRRLVRDRVKNGEAKKVFLILDNLRLHHANVVTKWIGKHKEEIEIFYLPPYAPEYNPDELLNSDVKRKAGTMLSPKSQAELIHNVRSRLSTLQRTPSIVSSFFEAPKTIYAGYSTPSLTTI